MTNVAEAIRDFHHRYSHKNVLNKGDTITDMTTVMSRFEIVTSYVIIECYVLTNTTNIQSYIKLFIVALS